MSIMNPFEKIPQNEINYFKEKVQRWVNIDKQIDVLEKQLKDLKMVRNKELEPEITKFMVEQFLVMLFIGKNTFMEIAG